MLTETKAPSLAELIEQREDAWTAMGVSTKSLAELPPKDREVVEAASRAFHEADREIVRRLRKAGRPLKVRKVELHLTADQDGFAVVDPAKGRLIHGNVPIRQCTTLLHRYG